MAIWAIGWRDLLWGSTMLGHYGGVLPCLVGKSNIKCPWKVDTRAVFSGKKKEMMNSNHTTRRLFFFRRHHFGFDDWWWGRWWLVGVNLVKRICVLWTVSVVEFERSWGLWVVENEGWQLGCWFWLKKMVVRSVTSLEVRRVLRVGKDDGEHVWESLFYLFFFFSFWFPLLCVCVRACVCVTTYLYVKISLLFSIAWSPCKLGDQVTQKLFSPLTSFFSHVVPL